MRGRYPALAGPTTSAEVTRALQPFIALSALASTLLIAIVGAGFLLPLALAQQRGWTGAGAPVGPGLALLAAPVLAVVYVASRKGVQRQLRPLAQVASEAARLLSAGAPRVHGRLRRGWGVSIDLPLQDDALRIVGARGPRARPELYLVRGAREYRFRDVRAPLSELDEALRAVGL